MQFKLDRQCSRRISDACVSLIPTSETACKRESLTISFTLWMTAPEFVLALMALQNTYFLSFSFLTVVDLFLQWARWGIEAILVLFEVRHGRRGLLVLRIVIAVASFVVFEECIACTDCSDVMFVIRMRYGMMFTEKVRLIRILISGFDVNTKDFQLRVRNIYSNLAAHLLAVVMAYVVRYGVYRTGLIFHQQTIGMVVSAVWDVFVVSCMFSILRFLQHNAAKQVSEDTKARINHSLKNVFAAISTSTHMLSEDLVANREKPVLVQELLQLSLCANYGVVVCNSAGVANQVMDKSYDPKDVEVSCKSLAETLKTFSRRILLDDIPEDIRIRVDMVAALIAIENALSNAKGHGDNTKGIHFKVYRARKWVIMQISNCVLPKTTIKGFTINPMYSRALFSEYPPLPPPSSIFESRSAESSFINQEHLSEGKGMGILKAVIRKGGYGLDFRQQGRLVFTRFAFPRAASTVKRDRSTVTPESEENGIDMSKLKVCFIDDMEMLRKVYKRMIENHFDQNGSSVLGETVSEVQNAAHHILRRNFDCCVVDQNLEYGQRWILGTDIIREARKMGYRGVMVIRSANCSDADNKFYKEIGADACFGKHSNLKEVRKRLQILVSKKTFEQCIGDGPDDGVDVKCNSQDHLEASFDGPRPADIRHPHSRSCRCVQRIRKRTKSQSEALLVTSSEGQQPKKKSRCKKLHQRHRII